MSSSSWNLQSKVSDLKFTVPPHVKPIRDKVLKFVEEECYPLENMKTISRDQAKTALKALQQKAKNLGLWALGHPKAIGGQGMPFRDYIYVNEVQGRSEIAQAALGTHSLQDSLMLYNHASEEIKNKYLTGIVAAEIYPSFAMTEPDIVSSDPTGIKTKAVLSADGKNWIINGHKWWTSNAANAAFTTVMLRTEFDPKVNIYLSFSMILVPTDTPGYRILRNCHVLGTHGVEHNEVDYNNVIVPYSNLIGQRGKGFLIAQERLGPGRIFHCMRWLGQMQRAFDLMCRRLSERKLAKSKSKSKKTLGDLQLMQKHIFDSYVDISSHRLMTMFAGEKMDSGSYARIELAAAKANGAQCLCRVMDRAIQVFGAKGLTEDTPLSEMYRHARAARFYDGPDEVHMATVGRLIHREYKKGKTYDFSAGGFTKSKL